MEELLPLLSAQVWTASTQCPLDAEAFGNTPGSPLQRHGKTPSEQPPHPKPGLFSRKLQNLGDKGPLLLRITISTVTWSMLGAGGEGGRKRERERASRGSNPSLPYVKKGNSTTVLHPRHEEPVDSSHMPTFYSVLRGVIDKQTPWEISEIETTSNFPRGNKALLGEEFQSIIILIGGKPTEKEELPENPQRPQQKLLNSRKQGQAEKTQVAVRLGTVPEAPIEQQWEESELELKELSTTVGTRDNVPESCEPRERKTGGGY